MFVHEKPGNISNIFSEPLYIFLVFNIQKLRLSANTSQTTSKKTLTNTKKEHKLSPHKLSQAWKIFILLSHNNLYLFHNLVKF